MGNWGWYIKMKKTMKKKGKKERFSICLSYFSVVVIKHIQESTGKKWVIWLMQLTMEGTQGRTQAEKWEECYLLLSFHWLAW